MISLLSLLLIPQLVYSANTDLVDYNKFDLDSGVKDIMWCGSSNEMILVLSEKGNVYRSRDRGASWKKIQQALTLSGSKVADENQDVGEVISLMQSPNDDSLVVLIGSTGINWVTEDCGANVRALNSGKRIHEFQFHPTEKYMALAATWTDCSEFGDDPCKIYKELYFTQDMGQSWKFLKEYVYDFAWGYTAQAQQNKNNKLPKERIFITHDPKASGHQNQDRKTWSPAVNLYYSDDFFKSKKLALNNGNSIIKTELYMFIAKANIREFVEIFVSTQENGFIDFERAKLPVDALASKSFTVMDTSENSVFLHVQNHGPNTPLGNIFISDGFGRNYSLSISNVLRGMELVDFEKVNSLEGVFLANKFNIDHSHESEFDSKIGNKKKTLSESQIVQERMNQLKRNKQINNFIINKKQQLTKESFIKEGDEFELKDLQQSIRTFITHNKGGKWELIKAPGEDSQNKKINCYVEDDCSLNLEIYSSNGKFAPPYSQESSIGLIIAVGNTGKQLEKKQQGDINTYISRDGGLNWIEVRKGSHIYEVGDHGGLIVMAKNDGLTKEVVYTYNEGLTWHTLEISSEPFTVTNIIIEPNSISQEFVVYGTYYDFSTEVPKGFVVTIDFKSVHEAQCKGADRPGDSDSDYELWTPFDGRHGDQKCFMGQQITYIRRKQSSECFNGEELERKILRSFCQCTEMDYECDYGYKKDGSQCIKEDWIQAGSAKANELTEQQQAMCNANGFYTVSQGYRKVPGNKCIGGIDLNPTVYSCSPVALFSFRSILYVVIIFGILYFGWPLIEAVLIALPIPDPKDIKEKIKSFFNSAMQQKNKFQSSSSTKKSNYAKGFGQAPESLGDSSDEEDTGKINSVQKLSYDSDDDKDHLKDTDLISLDGPTTRDRTGTAAEKIPKLQKPQ